MVKPSPSPSPRQGYHPRPFCLRRTSHTTAPGTATKAVSSPNTSANAAISAPSATVIVITPANTRRPRYRTLPLPAGSALLFARYARKPGYRGSKHEFVVASRPMVKADAVHAQLPTNVRLSHGSTHLAQTPAICELRLLYDLGIRHYHLHILHLTVGLRQRCILRKIQSKLMTVTYLAAFIYSTDSKVFSHAQNTDIHPIQHYSLCIGNERGMRFFSNCHAEQ